MDSSAICTVTHRISVSASALGCREASGWLADWGALHGLSDSVLMRLDLCLNEAMANVISHGGPSATENPIGLTLDLRTIGSASVVDMTISDAGLPFNPLHAQTSPQAQSLEDAVPGGLGLLMLRSNSDALDYRWLAGRNELTVTVRCAHP